MFGSHINSYKWMGNLAGFNLLRPIVVWVNFSSYPHKNPNSLIIWTPQSLIIWDMFLMTHPHVYVDNSNKIKLWLQYIFLICEKKSLILNSSMWQCEVKNKGHHVASSAQSYSSWIEIGANHQCCGPNV